MPIVNGISADHHKYVIEGMIDAEVVERQSRQQAEKEGSSTLVHYHRSTEDCDGKKHKEYGSPQIIPSLV